jgi:hypothetical protein
MKKPISSYIENGIRIDVYEAPQKKRQMWMKNDTFYAAKMRIEEPGTMFTAMTRKPGKA